MTRFRSRSTIDSSQKKEIKPRKPNTTTSRDRDYCTQSLRTVHAGDPTVTVLCDHRTDFNVARIRPMGAGRRVVVLGVSQPLDPSLGTYSIARNGGRAVLAIELGSPETRRNDLYRKPCTLFFRIGLEKYVFVDRGPRGNRPRLQLNCHRRGRATTGCG